MTRLLEILISLAIVAGLFLVVALVLPSERSLTERIETNRRLTTGIRWCCATRRCR